MTTGQTAGKGGDPNEVLKTKIGQRIVTGWIVAYWLLFACWILDAGLVKFIPYTAKKRGDNSWLIKPQKPLTPGEYAIMVNGNRKIFNLFGVD